MNASLLISIVIFTLLEVVRAEYARSYGVEPKDSLCFVGLVGLSLVLAFLSFPLGFTSRPPPPGVVPGSHRNSNGL